ACTLGAAMLAAAATASLRGTTEPAVAEVAVAEAVGVEPAAARSYSAPQMLSRAAVSCLPGRASRDGFQTRTNRMAQPLASTVIAAAKARNRLTPLRSTPRPGSAATIGCAATWMACQGLMPAAQTGAGT